MALPLNALPKHITKLPILGKEISFRPFTVREEKILVSAASGDEDDKLRAMEQIIENCTFGKLNMTDLTYVDMQSLLLAIRSKSVGETVVVSHTCTNCDKENSVEINLTKSYLTGNVPDTKIMIADNIGIVMKYPTTGLLKELTNKEISTDESLVEFIVISIQSIFDEDSVYDTKDFSNEELREWVLNLTHEQSMKIKNFFDSIPRLEISRKYKCSNCGQEHEIKVDTFENFTF